MKFFLTISSLLFSVGSASPIQAAKMRSLGGQQQQQSLSSLREGRRLDFTDACNAAFDALHENNSQFDEILWNPAIIANEGDENGENAICPDPWCDVDAHSLIGKEKVDKLIDECFAIDGAFALKEDYNQDCEEDEFDYKFLNFMDCYPKECEGQATEEEFETSNVEFMENDYNATCTMDVTLTDPNADTSSAPAAVGIAMGFSVAAATSISVLASFF